MATPLQYSCLENPIDRGAWWAICIVHGVTESRTRLSDFNIPIYIFGMIYPWSRQSFHNMWKQFTYVQVCCEGTSISKLQYIFADIRLLLCLSLLFFYQSSFFRISAVSVFFFFDTIEKRHREWPCLSFASPFSKRHFFGCSLKQILAASSLIKLPPCQSEISKDWTWLWTCAQLSYLKDTHYYCSKTESNIRFK